MREDHNYFVKWLLKTRCVCVKKIRYSLRGKKIQFEYGIEVIKCFEKLQYFFFNLRSCARHSEQPSHRRNRGKMVYSVQDPVIQLTDFLLSTRERQRDNEEAIETE